MYLPTIVHTLPQPSLPNISVGAPVWSLKLALRTDPTTTVVSDLDVPINITFPHTYPVSLIHLYIVPKFILLYYFVNSA